MSERLEAWFGDRRVGLFCRDRGVASFEYDDDWRLDAEAFPISLSMPLTRGRAEGDAVVAFLDGLLPDNPGVRGAWGQRFHVDARNPFALLRYVGSDVAEALAYRDPDSEQVAASQGDRRLSEHDLAEFVRKGVRESATWGVPGTAGRFSLAGQQSKMAVLRRGDEWLLASPEEPSTHILKPGLVDYADSALAEHLTMRLAAAVGLSVAATEMITFEDVSVLAVTRFDRDLALDGSSRRIHQEDFCQALGVPPTRRYENDGGPGILAMADALSRALRARDSVRAKRALLDAVAFNWLALGTDAHAKNYSLQHRVTGTALAPLYDVMSAAPHPRQINPRDRSTKLAQPIGGEYRFRAITARQWGALARGLGRKPLSVIERVEELGALVVENAASVAEAHGGTNLAFAESWQVAVTGWAESVRRIPSPATQ